jgi:hypothetical protein
MKPKLNSAFSENKLRKEASQLAEERKFYQRLAIKQKKEELFDKIWIHINAWM